MYKFLLALVVAAFAVSVPVAQATDSAMPGANTPEVPASGHGKHHHGKHHKAAKSNKVRKEKSTVDSAHGVKPSSNNPPAE